MEKQETQCNTSLIQEAISKFQLPGWMIEYAQEMIQNFNMDDSHGLVHCYSVYTICKHILWNLDKDQHVKQYLQCTNSTFITTSLITDMTLEESIHTILYAAFVHDTIDKKYMQEEQGIKILQDYASLHLMKSYMIEAIIQVITHISYSTRMKQRKLGLDEIPKNQYILATYIVADADLLAGYEPARCWRYTIRTMEKESTPGSKNSQVIEQTFLSLMNSRMTLYKDMVYTQWAKQKALVLHAELLEFLSMNKRFFLSSSL
jgi:hypothetical protein